MRTFTSEQVEAKFKRLAEETLGSNHEELRQGKFRSYDEFEKHQHEKRKPIWINALVEVSGCKRRDALDEQWHLFGEIFHRFYSEHIEWLKDPQSCPPEIKDAVEAELGRVIGSFVEDKKCHWKRNHEFVCFCK